MLAGGQSCEAAQAAYVEEIKMTGGQADITRGQYGSILMFVAGILVMLRIKHGPPATVYVDELNRPVLERGTEFTIRSTLE